MRSITSLLLGPLGFVVALAAVGCGGTEVEPGVSQANPLDSEEDALIYELNRFREDNGISGAVVVCKSLNVSASKHSDDMRDNDYLSDEGLDGSTSRSRACDAGYQTACSDTSAMAELVASGLATGKETFNQWATEESTKGLLTNGALIAAGVGRSLGLEDSVVWTLDLASGDDASCH